VKSPAKEKAPDTAKAKNRGSLKINANIFKIGPSLSETVGSGWWPSGSQKKTITRNKDVITAKTKKMACHLHWLTIHPPTVGAKSGDTLKISMSFEKTLAPSSGEKKSRTMAVEPTEAAHPPRA
jgi:hypothetical protein